MFYVQNLAHSSLSMISRVRFWAVAGIAGKEEYTTAEGYCVSVVSRESREATRKDGLWGTPNKQEVPSFAGQAHIAGNATRATGRRGWAG